MSVFLSSKLSDGLLRFYYILSLFFLLLLPYHHVNGQITACVNGVLSLSEHFTDMVPVPPPGHRNVGSWSSTPALNFTNPIDPNAVASGFVANTTYTITWTHQGRQEYDLTVIVGTDVATSAVLLNNKTPKSTSDVVLCSPKPNWYSFTVQNDPSLDYFEFWVTHDADGLSEQWSASSTSNSRSITKNDWDDHDQVWAIVEDFQGCLSVTNDIMMSMMTGTQVEVQGGASVCQANVATLGLVLEVTPYDSPTFTYQWYRNGIAIAGATGSTYPITQTGDFYVIVTGCSTTYTSNTVSVTNETLPTVTISGNDLCAYPSTTTTTITSVESGGTILPPYVYSWYFDGYYDSSLGTLNTIPTGSAGEYVLRLTSSTDEECHNESNPLTISLNEITSATLTKSNGPFCASDPAANRIPQMLMNLVGGTGPYNVVLSANGVSQPAISVTSGVVFSTTSISTTTTYSVVSISDASGCSMDPLLFPANVVFTVNPNPAIQNLNSTANVCAGTPATIGLQNSQIGITYTLRRDVSGVITDLESITRAATGAFNFVTTPSTVGIYYVVAQSGTCAEVTMNGTREILPVPSVFNLGVTQAAPYCSGNGYNITLSGSETGVTYTLYRGAVAVDNLPGDGNLLTFNAQSTAGTYSIRASNGACAVVNMSGSLVINSSPTIYNITGGNGCADSPLTIGLSSSTAGIQYNLYHDPGSGSVLVGTVNGPGGAFSFGSYTTAGIYFAEAVNTTTSCSSTMNGTIDITDIPIDVPFVTTGQVCDFGTVALTTSQVGVQYQLRRDGINVGVPINGTGGIISFGNQGVAGIYTVYAVHTASTCDRVLSNSLEVQEFPITYTLSANKLSYCSGTTPTGIVLTLSNSELGVSYQLYNAGGPYGGAVSGTGSPLVWSNIPNGSYYVVGTTTGGCSTTMNGNPVISISPLPTGTISVLGSNNKCAGAPGTFTIDVSLTGTTPYNFTIIDDKGNSYPVAGWGTNQYTMSVNPATTTTYTLSTLTDNSGCSGTLAGVATITINPVPTVNITGTTSICIGSSTTLTASGAGAGGSYLWSTGANTAAITVAPTINGTVYDVIATTAAGCTDNESVNITVNSLPVVDFTGFASPPTYCADDPSVSLTGLPAMGGTFTGPGIVGTDFVPSLANIGVGNAIYYTYTDGNGCTNTSPTQTVWVNPLPTVNIVQLDNDYCADQGSITLTGTPTNASGTFSILTPGANWGDNGNGTAWFNPSASIPGTNYSVRYSFIDGNGCTNYIDENANVLPDLNSIVSFSGLPANPCQDDATVYVLTGSNAPSGTFSGPGITDNGDGTADFVASVAGNGTHTITYSYTDPGTGCVGNYSETITIGTALGLPGVNSLYCQYDAAFAIQGSNHPDGTITLSGGGLGVPVSGPSGSVTFNPGVLTPGIYDVLYEYTDINGCANSMTWNIELVATPDATFNTASGLVQYCVSETNVQLVPNMAGGFFSGTGVSGDIFNPSVAGPGVHTITYEINTGGCIETSTLNISVIALDVISIDNLDPAYCDNEAVTPIAIQASNLGVAGAVYTFTSTTNGIGVSPITDNGNGTATFNPNSVGAGFYTVTYTFDNTANNGCVSTYNQVVQVHASLGVNFGGIADPLQYCNDDAPVTLTGSFVGTGSFTGAGAFTGNGITDAVPTDGIAIFDPTAVAIGTHPITFTYTTPVAQGSCVTSRTKDINILADPVIYNMTPDAAIPNSAHFCDGDPGITIGVDFSQVGVDYYLILNGNYSAPVQTQAGDGNDIQFAAPVTVEGIYTVMGENASGCTSIMNGTVTVVRNSVSASVSKTNVSCRSGNDGEIVITASGGSLNYVYSIDNGATTQPSNTFSGLIAGAYQVTVEDAIGCTLPVAIPVNITEPANDLTVALISTNDVGCTPCTAGLDCEGSATISVSGGTIFTNPVLYPEGYDIRWEDSGTNVVGTTLTVNGLAPDTYTVYIEDANGCTQSQVVTIGSLTPLTISKHPNPALHINNVCNGGLTGSFTVIATGGSGDYQFSKDNVNWYSEVNPADDSYTFNNLAANTYTVWVRDQQHTRCKAVIASNIVITEPTALVTTLVSVSHISCNGAGDGTFEVTASGGLSGSYEYSIDGTIYQASGVFSGLSAGTYTVWTRDPVNGCVVSDLAPIVINEPSSINVTAQKLSDVTCFGGSDGEATVIASGGTGVLTYEWENTAAPGVVISTNVNVTNLSVGNYIVTATDSEGCSNTSAPVTISQPAVSLDFNVSTNSVACPCVSGSGTCEGEATITSISGGTAPYAILWSTGGAGVTESDLEPGIYSVTVTDGNGCVLNKPFVIGMLAPLNVVENGALHQNNSCNGGSNGSFTVVASGGSGSYLFSLDNSTWLSSGLNTYTFTGLTSGNYDVWVMDAANIRCSYQMAAPVAITDAPALTLAEVSRTNVDCNGGANGEIEVFGGGGSGSYEYSIDGGLNWQVSPLFTGLSAGNYYVWVRDGIDNTCIYTGLPVIAITQPTIIAYGTIKTNATCFGADDGTIIINASGGSGSYAYSIDGAATWQLTNTYSGLVPAIYPVLVRDAAATGCVSALNNVVITEPADISATLTVGSLQHVDCFGDATGSFSVDPVPITSSLEYRINGGAWQSSRAFSGLTAGTYNVSVRNGVCTNNNVLTVTINEPAAALQITSVSITDVTCGSNSTAFVADGEILVNVTGGTLPYTYTWIYVPTNTPVGGNTNNPTGLQSGDYDLLVTDATGKCSVSATYTINPKTDWNVTYTKTNVTVAGGNDGTIDITNITGGNGGITITWSDGAAYDGLTNRTGLASGVYTYTVTDGLGCSWSEPIVITDGSALNVTFNGSNILCRNDATGFIDVLITNGTPTYNIIWSGALESGGTVNGSDTNIPNGYTINNLEAGTYNITITDNAGAGASVSDVVLISQPAQVIGISTVINNVTCYGNDDGQLSITATGGTVGAGGYTIDVLPGFPGNSGTNLVLNSLEPRPYNIYVTDDNGCQETVTETVTEPNDLVVTTSSVPVTCNGGNDGSITAVVTGRPVGNAYQYDWEEYVAGAWVPYAMNTTPTINGLSSGTYHVIATSISDGCNVTSNPILIIENNALDADITVTNVTRCNGDLSGAFYIEVTGGLAPYTLDYGNPGDIRIGNGPFNVTGLAAGSYTITITDVNGCNITSPQTITQPSQMNVSNITYWIDCETNNTGTLTFDVNGGTINTGNQQYYIVLQAPGGINYANTTTIASGTTYNASYTNMVKGAYTLTVYDNYSSPTKCNVIETFNLELIDITGTITDATCTGVNTGSVTGVAINGTSGNYSYVWTTAGGSGLNPGNLDQSGLSAGTYNLSVTDNIRGCTVAKDFIVGNLFALTINGAIKDVTCSGSSDGSITSVSVSGATAPVTYNWSGPSIVNPALSEQYNLAGGTYLLNATDANGCQDNETFIVDEPAAITFDLSTVLEGCDPYSRGINLTNLTGGVPLLGNYNFFWQGPGSTTNTQNQTGLIVGGDYIATVTDNNGCTGKDTITISGQIKITPTVSPILCNGATNGAISLAITGGSGAYSYQWNQNGVPYANTKDISGLTAATYYVMVTDLVEADLGGNCMVDYTIDLTQPNPILVNGSITHITCEGDANGAITLNVLGGTGNYTYTWSSANGTGLVPGAKNQSGLTGGTYTVVVEDDNNCTANASFTVNEPAALGYDLNITDTQCDGTSGSIEVQNQSGGTAPYQYIWAGPSITPGDQNSTLVNNLLSGTYTVSMSDSYGCTLTQSADLTESLDVTYVLTDETCASAPDGSIDITVIGGVAPLTFTWTTVDGGNLTPGVPDQNGLPAGTYSLLIQDGRGCTFSKDFEIKKASVIQIVGAITHVMCYNVHSGAINLTVTGGSGTYNYNWTGTGAGLVPNSEDQINLEAGTYTVTVQDAVSGCSETKVFVVNGPSTPINLDNINVVDVLCKGDFTGEIEVQASGGAPYDAGGTPFYHYTWNGFGSFTDAPVQTNLHAGNYEVIIIDANGCQLNSPIITIDEPVAALTASVASIQDVTSNGGNDGEIEINVSGGTGSYTIVWSGVDLSNNPVPALPADLTHQTNLVAGTYEAIITDDNGCTYTLSNIFVNQPDRPLTMAIDKLDITCNGDNDGQIIVTVTGGTNPYEITWSNPSGQLGQVNASSVTISNLTADIYTIQVEDDNDKLLDNQVTIVEPSPLVLSANVSQHVTCYEGSNGEISLVVNGGTPSAGNYYVRISGGGSYSNIRTDIQPGVVYTYPGLRSGDYNIRLIDDRNGDGVFNINEDCSRETSLTINQPVANVVISGDQQVCDGDMATLVFVTTNWSNIMANPLDVTLSDGTLLSVDDSPYSYSYVPVSSDVITITNVEVGGCDKGAFSGSASVVVNDRPTARIRKDETICEGDAVNLYFDLTGTGPWTVTYFNGSFDVTISNILSTPHQITVSPAVTTTYAVRSVTDSNCSFNYDITDPLNTNRVTVSINTLPDVTISGNADICYGSSTNLTFNFNFGTPPYSVTFNENGVPKSLYNILASPYIYTVTPSDTTTYELVSATDANGCSKPASGAAYITVRPVPGPIGSIYGTDLVCQGETNVSFYINPVTYATSYVWQLPAGFTLTSGLGSDSITVDISPTATQGTIRVYAGNNCGDSPLSGKLINVDPLPDRAITITCDQGTQICQGTTSLVFRTAVVPNATSYQWTVPGGFNIISGQGTATLMVDLDPNQSGISGDVTVTATNSCGTAAVSDPLNITINPLPAVNAGFDQNVCGTSTSMAADNPGVGYTGAWTIIYGSASIVSLNSPISLINNLAKGENRFVWTVTNNATGCVQTDTVSVFNNTLAVNASFSEHVVCDGSVTVYGTPLPTGTTGLWTFTTGSGGFTTASLATTDVANLAPDQNIMRWTITKNGCTSYDEVEVINDKPDNAVITNTDPVSLCASNVTLNAVPVNPGMGSGLWIRVSGDGTLAADPTTPTINITNLGEGDNVFRWTVTKNACSLSDEITVRNNLLTVSAGVDEVICEDNIQLDGSSVPSGVTGRWYIPGDLGGSGTFSNAFIPDPVVTGIGQGDNYYIWEQNQNGCITTDTVLITSNRPTTATVGSYITICADTAVLTGNAPDPGFGSGFWSIVSGSGKFDDPTDPNTIVRDTKEGSNVYRWTIANNGCFSTADINVMNQHVPVFAGKDTAVCKRYTYLNADVPVLGTGEWSIVPGLGSATIDDNTDPNTRIGGLAAGNNAFVWTINYNNCVSRDTVVITNNTPSAANAGLDQTINGSATNLNALPVSIGNGLWSIVSGGANIDQLNNPFTGVSNLQRGPNIFRWTVTHLGCTDDDEVTITNGQTIDAEAGVNQEVCGTVAELYANDPDVGIGEWSIVSGSGQFLNSSDYKTTVSNLGSGANIFRWTIYYTNSSSSDTVVITNSKPTDAFAGPDRTICDTQHTLEASIPSVGTPSWSIISGGGTISDITDPNSLITGLAKGVNVLKYQITNSICKSIDSVRITNGLPTIPDAGLDQVLCVDSTQLIPNNPAFGTGEWISSSSATIDGNIVTHLDPGPNEFIWVISTSNCSLSDTVFIQNNKPSDAHAGFDRGICVDTVQLSANLALYQVGTWQRITGTGIIEDINDPQTVVRSLSKGANRFRWTIDNNGCKSTSDVIISNNLIESFAGFDQVNCADTALLVANNPFPGMGTWGVIGGSGNANFDDPSSPYTTVRSLGNGENILTWTIDYQGCQSVTQVSITNNNPTKANAGINRSTCYNYINLSANMPAIGIARWTIRNGSGVFVDDSNPTTIVNDLSFGKNMFRWTIENEGCVSYDDVEITFNTIQAVVGQEQQICDNTTVLEANNAEPGIGTWSVAGGEGQAVFSDTNEPNTIVSNLAKGRNVLIWTINNEGCTTTDTVNVYNNSTSQPYAGNNVEICIDSMQLDATIPDIGIGSWEVLTGGGTIENANSAKSWVTDLSKGDNVFQWTLRNGDCNASDIVRIVNNQPSVPYAGADFEICSRSMTLKADIPEYGDGLWTIENGSGNIAEITNAVTSVSNVGYGQNRFRWTIKQGQCELHDEILVTNNTATAANAGPDVLDCKDESYLDANSPEYGSGLWSIISGQGTFDDINDPKTRIYNLGFGENILLWTIQNGTCFSTDQVTIFNQVPDQASAGSDRTICENYVVLNSNNPSSGTGTWSVVSGAGEFEDPNRYDTRVNNVGFGQNIYKWTINYGSCTTEDVVTVVSNKSYPFAGVDATINTPEYIMLAGNPGALTGTWSVVGGSGTFEDVNNYNSRVTNIGIGANTYRWSIDVAGCTAYDDVIITYDVVPETGFTASPNTGCYPLTVQFYNATVGGTSFTWNFGDGQTSTVFSPSHTYNDPGEYTVTLSVPGPGGVDVEYNQIVSIYDHPHAEFEVSPAIAYIPDDALRCFNHSTDGTEYLWNFGDGNTSIELNPSYTYTSEGIYDVSLLVTNEYGCQDQFVINDAVEVILQGRIIFPNAFKPERDASDNTEGSNGTGTIEMFMPVNPDQTQANIAEYHLQIFNRWGQMVFESENVKEGWNGHYNNQLAPQGVYVYKSWGKFISGKEFRVAGSVMLVR